ncbi:hypothetical protein BJV82DRAFT_611047, partial [Fennellomyces sp. T-0311]
MKMKKNSRYRSAYLYALKNCWETTGKPRGIGSADPSCESPRIVAAKNSIDRTDWKGMDSRSQLR